MLSGLPHRLNRLLPACHAISSEGLEKLEKNPRTHPPTITTMQQHTRSKRYAKEFSYPVPSAAERRKKIAEDIKRGARVTLYSGALYFRRKSNQKVSSLKTYARVHASGGAAAVRARAAMHGKNAKYELKRKREEQCDHRKARERMTREKEARTYTVMRHQPQTQRTSKERLLFYERCLSSRVQQHMPDAGVQVNAHMVYLRLSSRRARLSTMTTRHAPPSEMRENMRYWSERRAPLNATMPKKTYAMTCVKRTEFLSMSHIHECYAFLFLLILCHLPKREHIPVFTRNDEAPIICAHMRVVFNHPSNRRARARAPCLWRILFICYRAIKNNKRTQHEGAGDDDEDIWMDEMAAHVYRWKSVMRAYARTPAKTKERHREEARRRERASKERVRNNQRGNARKMKVRARSARARRLIDRASSKTQRCARDICY